MLERTLVTILPPIAILSELAGLVLVVALGLWWSWRFGSLVGFRTRGIEERQLRLESILLFTSKGNVGMRELAIITLGALAVREVPQAYRSRIVAFSCGHLADFLKDFEGRAIRI